MTHLSIRFLIGLAAANDPLYPDRENMAIHETRTKRALNILARNYPAFTSWRGQGYWLGTPEPTLVVEVLVEGTDTEGDAVGRAQYVAGEVARALDQDSVALAVAPVRFSLEGPHGTV